VKTATPTVQRRAAREDPWSTVVWFDKRPRHPLTSWFHCLFISRNVASIREAKREAQNERDRLQNLLEGLPVPVVHGHHEGNRLSISTVNGTFEETFGYSGEEVEGKDLHDLVVPPEKREDAAGLHRKALKDGLAKQEVRRLTSEGPRDFQLQIAPALNHGSAETYAVYTDITERKERERRLSAIFNQTYQFTGLMEPDGTLIEVNDTVLRFGGPRRSARSSPMRDCPVPDPSPAGALRKIRRRVHRDPHSPSR